MLPTTAATAGPAIDDRRQLATQGALKSWPAAAAEEQRDEDKSDRRPAQADACDGQRGSETKGANSEQPSRCAGLVRQQADARSGDDVGHQEGRNEGAAQSGVPFLVQCGEHQNHP
jgi:hypothetical protein